MLTFFRFRDSGVGLRDALLVGDHPHGDPTFRTQRAEDTAQVTGLLLSLPGSSYSQFLVLQETLRPGDRSLSFHVGEAFQFRL